MGILLGIVSFFLGFAVNGLDYMVKVLYEPFGYELATFEKYFPAAQPFREMFVYLGVGIMLILYLFTLLKNFGLPIGIEAEEPIKLTMKIALFWALIINSESITDEILQMFTRPLEIFTDTDMPFNTLDLMDTVLNIVGIGTGVGLIINVVLTLILGWQFVKLLLEIVERYVVLCFVVYIAPVAFSVGPFEGTNQIFKSWCRLFASQMLLMMLNVWSVRLFTSFFAFELGAYTGTDFIIAFLIGFAFLKFAQKIDTLLRIVGLNTASSGGGLGSSISGMVMSTMAMTRMAKSASKGFAGKSSGANGEGGKNSSSTQGGSSSVKMGQNGAFGSAKSTTNSNATSNPKIAQAMQNYTQAKQQNSVYASNSSMVKNSSDLVNSSDSIMKGNEANAVAGSLFSPQDGFEQTPLKMDNGDDGFLYRNPSTGAAYGVSFNTAGDGIVTGEMGSYDMQTGGMGEMTPFTIASEDTANALGINSDGANTMQGNDGNAYVPVENITSSSTPFKMNASGESANTVSTATQNPMSATAQPQVASNSVPNTAQPSQSTLASNQNVPQSATSSTVEQMSQSTITEQQTTSSMQGQSATVGEANVPIQPNNGNEASPMQQRGEQNTPIQSNGNSSAQQATQSVASSSGATINQSKTIGVSANQTVESTGNTNATNQPNTIGTSANQTVGATGSSTDAGINQSKSIGVSANQTMESTGNSNATGVNQSNPISQNASNHMGNAEQFSPQQGANSTEMKPTEFVARAQRMEPTSTPIPTNLQGKAEDMNRAAVTENSSTKIDDINSPTDSGKISLGEKAHNMVARIKDIFK